MQSVKKIWKEQKLGIPLIWYLLAWQSYLTKTQNFDRRYPLSVWVKLRLEILKIFVVLQVFQWYLSFCYIVVG